VVQEEEEEELLGYRVGLGFEMSVEYLPLQKRIRRNIDSLIF
jgi:hypothetical protein